MGQGGRLDAGTRTLREGPAPLNVSCTGCGSTRLSAPRHSDRWNFDVHRCRDCGTAFAVDGRTPEELESRYDNARQDTYLELMREPTAAYESVLAGMRERLAPCEDPMLFDVGAGTGDFLAAARASHFRVSGSELSSQAADYTLRRHGIELNTRRLSDQQPESVDALTMWCVIAHVADPGLFLSDALAMLRPGGVLFLRTPRWCLLDGVGVLVGKATGGRSSNVSDWRVTHAHLHLFSDQGLRQLLRNAGFTDVEIVPTCHFGFSPDAYARRLHPQSLARTGAAGVDWLITRGWFIRNAAFAWARRPDAE